MHAHGEVRDETRRLFEEYYIPQTLTLTRRARRVPGRERAGWNVFDLFFTRAFFLLLRVCLRLGSHIFRLTAVEECHGLVQELDAEIDKQLTEARALMQLIPMSVQRETNSRVVAAFLLKKQHDEILKLKEESFISVQISTTTHKRAPRRVSRRDREREWREDLFVFCGIISLSLSEGK